MPKILSEKIKVGVSACNFGALVRYNRKGWDRIGDLGREKDAFIWTPVCPEAMSGLGVPRPAMKLVDGSGDDFWQGRAKMKNRQGQIVSAQAKAGAQAALDNLKRAGVEAFVFMDGSPSCGVYRTTLKNARLGRPPGVFGSLLLKEQLFLIPALDLDSHLKWWDWRRRLHAFVWLKRADIKSKKDLIDIWHDFKFLCQEASRVRSDELGRKIANMPKRIDVKFIESCLDEMMQILRLPSNMARIENSAKKQMAFFCKHFNIACQDKIPAAEQGKRKYVEKLKELEKRAVQENIDYGFIPVIFRETR